MNDLKVLLRYLRTYLLQLTLGVICVLLTVTFSLMPPWVLKFAVDDLTQNINAAQLLNYAVLIVCITAIAGCFRYLMRRILISLSRKIEYHIRSDYYSHLQKLSNSFFFEWRTGDLISRISNDLNAVRNVLGPGIMYTIHTVTLFCSAMVLMMVISRRLTLIILLPLLLLTLATKYFSHLLFFRYQSVQEGMAQLTSRAQENLSGIRMVKAYGREQHEINLFRQVSEDYLTRNLDLARIWGAFFPFLITLSGTGVVIILWFGGKMVILKQLSLGELVAFMGYWTLLTWPMMALGWVMNIWQRGAVAMGRINQVMKHRPTITDGTVILEEFQPRIEFRNLTFTYPGASQATLKEINLTIAPGMTVAVVGATGCGKSTLVNLLAHLWETPTDSLFISGHDINELQLRSLRRNIGMVDQEPFLFSDTIRNNITFGAPLAGPAELEAALNISQLINDLEDFPKGLDTRIGERGITLSGGQKQRLAIARAVIRKPQLLIFDDALSSVDLHTEEEILKHLTELLKGRTCILISHRMSSIKNSDLIVVLDEGRITELGCHDELIANESLYYRIYQRQQLLEEIEAAE